MLEQGFLDIEQAAARIRTKIYELYNQVYELLQPLERKVARYNQQVLASLSVILRLRNSNLGSDSHFLFLVPLELEPSFLAFTSPGKRWS